MWLYELAEGEPIQIIASKNKSFVHYDTTVEACRQGIILVEPIRQNGIIINFQGEEVRCDVAYMEGEANPICWEGCAIQVVTIKGHKYHAIYSKKMSKKLNRREAYRQYLGLKGTLTLDGSRGGGSVIVKDISTTGVAFVGDPKLDMETVGNFQLDFDDTDCRLNVHLNARAVREIQVDENKKVFGAVIKKSNVNLSSYISTKQNIEIAKRRARQGQG